MLLNPRTPLFFGILMILAYGSYLTVYYPTPGKLAAPHSHIDGLNRLAGCKDCHSASGLSDGCLSCHGEIATQLRDGDGYHAFLQDLGKQRCASCHQEHFGENFSLVNSISWEGIPAESFNHPHVAFALEGAHASLECDSCHSEKYRDAIALASFPESPRKSSYLGLTQKCVACHEDVHSGGLSGECDSCHGQEHFQPADHFDHDEHFLISGGHLQIECRECHVLSEPIESDVAASLPFEDVRGTRCHDCHENPHYAAFEQACEDCHVPAAPPWTDALTRITDGIHANAGFRLEAPHSDVACAECHDPELAFTEKYHDPSSEGYRRSIETCDGCHSDAHAGQFLPVDRTVTGDRASPVDRTVTGDRASSDDRVIPVDRVITDGRACIDCHERTHFRPSRIGLDAHESAFPLQGAHRGVPCASCHVLDDALGTARYVNTTRECKSCHEDIHRRQFATDLEDGDCTACHVEDSSTFTIRPFDHEKATGYVLAGGHARATCQNCHRTRDHDTGNYVAYRGTEQKCSSCHRDIHVGQFAESEKTECERCHSSFTDWKTAEFDHDRDSRFSLEGIHTDVACAKCHKPQKLPNGTEVTRYKPLGIECRDCHEVVPEK